jgi:NADPH-dependent glutamate synthase beta subunit-like oxidoreductase/Fe-S oxidoreductase/coenzyme F420-reducing hydrogenase delta subunit
MKKRVVIMPRKPPKVNYNDSYLFDFKQIIEKNQHIININGKKYRIEFTGKPSCTETCPAGINVKAYINLIANKKFEEAVEIIREKNPFPAVCGRVCTRPCENECFLTKNGDSIPIRALKRYASNYELARRPLNRKPCPITKKEKVAIVGAGPAGLTAAVDLIRLGYSITVYEKEDEPGGMLRFAIPPYRLPDRVLKREIDWIENLGITIQTNTFIKDPSSLLKKGFSAVLIAGGTPNSISLKIPGGKTSGIIDPLIFLKKINEKNPPSITGDVIVIGGGSTAFDAARSARRLGAKKVTIVYRRGIEEMPADHEEIDEAQTEGVKIQILAIPKKIILQNNKATGVQFLKAKLGKPDSSGRKRPEPIPNSEFIINATTIIPAIGAKPDVGLVAGETIIKPNGTIQITEYGKTKLKGLFAAGDVETGPTSIVEAIGRGHHAANGINSYLQNIQPNQPEEITETIQIYPHTKILSPKKYTPSKKQGINITDFEEIEQSYSEYEAVEEAQRCYSCGPCYTCTTCLPNCANKQLTTTIDNRTILTKTPIDLALSITKNGPATIQINDNNHKKTLILTSLLASIDKDLCIGCGRCEELCAYHAITTTLTKDHQIYATIAPTTCAACSTCVSKCPSGAITQGYMTDADILHRIHQKNQTYNGVTAFISHWHTQSTIFDIHEATIDLMSITKASPIFLIQALAHSGKGILIIQPEHATDYHYLPWEENPNETIQHTKNLLQMHGISPDRIRLTTIPRGSNPTHALQQFTKNLERKKLSNIVIPLPNNIHTPLGKTFAILRMMAATPDQSIINEKPYLPPAHKDGIAYFGGCLPLLATIGHMQKLFNLNNTQNAQAQLIKKIYPDIGTIPKLTCPSKGLLSINDEKIIEIVDTIAQHNHQALDVVSPQKIIIGTPEAYISFSHEKIKPELTTLPDELLPITKKLQKIKPINKTLALHKACKLHIDPFYEPIKKLLQSIPGITLIDLPETCGHEGFDVLNSQTNQIANSLIDHAADQGAEQILCTSPYCQSHLLLTQREGSWKTTDIEIGDIYTILYNLLEEN